MILGDGNLSSNFCNTYVYKFKIIYKYSFDLSYVTSPLLLIDFNGIFAALRRTVEPRICLLGIMVYLSHQYESSNQAIMHISMHITYIAIK